MNSFKFKSHLHLIAAMLSLVFLTLSQITIADSDQNTNINNSGNYSGINSEINQVGGQNVTYKYIRGVAVTGFNSIAGQPFYNWGGGFGTFGFPTVARYNRYGQQPLPIDQNTPDSAVLATAVAPEFLALVGKTRADVDPNLENVPLRRVPVNVDFEFIRRERLPGIFRVDATTLSQAWPANHITLGKWLDATGLAKIECFDDNSLLKLVLKNLIPNRMYAVWGTLGGGTFAPFAIGGLPNIFLTDEHGNAKFRRVLNFCPLDPSTSDRPLLVINLQYHANQQSYGAVPEPSAVDGFWAGIVTQLHMQFPVNVEVLK